MSKTIVNIIDQSNPLPAYLFTKEYYEDGDELLFISTEEESGCIKLIANQLEVDETHVKSIIVKRYQDNFLYERICRTIKGNLIPNNWIYFFAEPEFLGKCFYMDDWTMFVKKEAYFVSMFSYWMGGFAFGNTAGMALARFNCNNDSNDSNDDSGWPFAG